MAKPPEGGIIEQTKIEKRLIPAEQVSESSIPDFWDYLESLTPELWNEHILYIYREDPKIISYHGALAYLDKWVGYVELTPGVQIPLRDRGDVEAAIREKFGGRAFRLILKRGNQRVTEGKSVNEAAPKFRVADSSAPSAAVPGAMPSDASAAATIGSKAIDALSGQDSQAIRLAMDVLSKAAEVISKPPAQPPTDPIRDKVIDTALERLLNPPVAPPAQPPTDPIRDKVIDTALERLLNPPVAPANPLMEKLVTVAIDRLLAPSAVTNNPLLDKIMGAAVDKILNPPPADRTNMGIELARQIPTVSSALKDSVHEWRLGVEAQERTAAIARGVALPMASGTYPANPPIQSVRPSAPSAAPEASIPTAMHGTQEISVDPPIEWIEHKIVAILKENVPVNETADETLAFLYRAYPAMINELLSAGDRMIAAGIIPASATPAEAGILKLFQTRPILQQVPVNPRLVEFIKTFVAYARKSEGETQEEKPVS